MSVDRAVVVLFMIAAAMAACQLLVGTPRDAFEPDGSSADVTNADIGPCTQTVCDGACVNLSSDPRHCGACAFDCLGAACDMGTCGPAVVAQMSQPIGCAGQSATDLFFSTILQPYKLWKVSKKGGAPVVIAHLDEPCSKDTRESARREVLVVESSRARWISPDGGAQLIATTSTAFNRGLIRGADEVILIAEDQIVWIARDGGYVRAPIASSDMNVVGAALSPDESTLYVGREIDGGAFVLSVVLDGGQPEPLYKTGIGKGEWVRALAVNDANVYYATANKVGWVARDGNDAGSFGLPITGSFHDSVRLAGDDLYWVLGGIFDANDGGVFRVHLPDGTRTTIAKDIYPTSVEIDGPYAYVFTRTSSSGQILRVPR